MGARSRWGGEWKRRCEPPRGAMVVGEGNVVLDDESIGGKKVWKGGLGGVEEALGLNSSGDEGEFWLGCEADCGK